MAETFLTGRAILVAEDEYMLANDLQRDLAAAGAAVIGPAATLEKVVGLIETADPIDAAILDINLRGELVFDAADMLVQRSVPFLFATGYDKCVIPPRFDHVLRCEKPIGTAKLRGASEKIIARRDASP